MDSNDLALNNLVTLVGPNFAVPCLNVNSSHLYHL